MNHDISLEKLRAIDFSNLRISLNCIFAFHCKCQGLIFGPILISNYIHNNTVVSELYSKSLCEMCAFYFNLEVSQVKKKSSDNLSNIFAWLLDKKTNQSTFWRRNIFSKRKVASKKYNRHQIQRDSKRATQTNTLRQTSNTKRSKQSNTNKHITYLGTILYQLLLRESSSLMVTNKGFQFKISVQKKKNSTLDCFVMPSVNIFPFVQKITGRKLIKTANYSTYLLRNNVSETYICQLTRKQALLSAFLR